MKKKRIIINLPKSHRNTSRFKSKFPNAQFYGATSLGSGRPSFIMDLEDYEQNIELLKSFKATKPKYQPFL